MRTKTWTDAELERDRQIAIRDFVQERLGEPLDVYLGDFDDAQDAVENLLEETLDLHLLLPNQPVAELRERLATIVSDKAQYDAFRYLAGPPISEADLLNVSDVPSIARSRIAGDPTILDRLASTVLSAHDRRRFPWLTEGREPEPPEKQAAIIATASLIAYQKNLTWRRNKSKSEQEQLVADTLVAAGFREVPTRVIEYAQDAPQPGEFCRETKIRTEKADIVVGLYDRRVAPVECKVSNSSVNSYKRLNREAAGKALVWSSVLGDQFAPASVLSGVYAMPSLQQAQNRGLSLFWAHDLPALTRWVEGTRPGV
ncbi:XamI family restriction endonuclease [Rubrivirga sp. S365]|uniref:XamI family restriction endonuclease n=1 Tax=Rubrivirga sp. S365 TaxID=3076080 RepID=UPI0028C5D5DC|nr:XamI family restriction endonuclease [Rubrivirga sp. S365]MDT7858235.1 XamI family restriction endonuclease [Rubrivirga sp. S365]